MGSLKENNSICFEILEFLETVVDCDRSGLLIVLKIWTKYIFVIYLILKFYKTHMGGLLSFGSLNQAEPINIY